MGLHFCLILLTCLVVHAISTWCCSCNWAWDCTSHSLCSPISERKVAICSCSRGVGRGAKGIPPCCASRVSNDEGPREGYKQKTGSRAGRKWVQGMDWNLHHTT
jgi:hypothetical protein